MTNKETAALLARELPGWNGAGSVEGFIERVLDNFNKPAPGELPEDLDRSHLYQVGFREGMDHAASIAITINDGLGWPVSRSILAARDLFAHSHGRLKASATQPEP